MSQADPIADHITAASQHAHEASQTYANPAISAAVSQAHALTAVALLLERLLTALDTAGAEEEEEYGPDKPLVYAVARVVGGEIMH